MTPSSSSSDNDSQGVTISFDCDYAKASHARCHRKPCEREISQGALRLSRLIPNPFLSRSPKHAKRLMPLYDHLPCLINYLRSDSEKKKRIEVVQNGFQGFDQLSKRDQQRLKKLFQSERQFKEKLTSPVTRINYFEHDGENKFWQISLDSKSTKTKYGLLDDPDINAIPLYKDFPSANEANKCV